MDTAPECSVDVSFHLKAMNRRQVNFDYILRLSGEPLKTSAGQGRLQLSTHMLYEALEVQIANHMRPLIDKFLTQIKEQYPV
jgi:hypothetical protein